MIAITYFEDVKYCNDSIVKYVSPDKTVDSVVENGATMCNKYSDILQEDRDLDSDHDRRVNGRLDR